MLSRQMLTRHERNEEMEDARTGQTRLDIQGEWKLESGETSWNTVEESQGLSVERAWPCF